MINLELLNFKNKQPTPIKYIIYFNEGVLRDRLNMFYKYEKNMKKLSYNELTSWIKLFKVNSETEINIKIKMDRYESEKRKRLNDKSKLIFILYHLLELSFLRTVIIRDEDRGKIVRAFKENDVEEKIVVPKVTKKLTRKEMLKLKKG